MEKYVEIIISGIYILLSVVMFIITWVNAIRSKNKATKEELTNKTISEIQDLAIDLIKEAETFKNYTGEEKLNWTITRLKQINQTLYNEDELIALVNKLVETTKKVNVSTGKKT